VAATRLDGILVVNPPAHTILRAGDRLRVFGLPAQIDALVTASGAAEDDPR
jgi:hypothetical protein